jgi:hypothetical protein
MPTHCLHRTLKARYSSTSWFSPLVHRAARARVLAALGKERGAGLQDITVMVCPVKDDGHVDMEHLIGRAALDVQQLLTDKRDLRGFSLQLVGPDEKPAATLTVDSNIAGVLQPMLVEGAGAVPGKGLRASGAQEAAVGELAKVFAGKGMSLRAVFQTMDQDCDGLISESDFVEAIANEKLSTDKADRGKMFAYIADGKETVDQRTFESVLGRASGSGVVLTQVNIAAQITMSTPERHNIPNGGFLRRHLRLDLCNAALFVTNSGVFWCGAGRC